MERCHLSFEEMLHAIGILQSGRRQTIVAAEFEVIQSEVYSRCISIKCGLVFLKKTS